LGRLKEAIEAGQESLGSRVPLVSGGQDALLIGHQAAELIVGCLDAAPACGQRGDLVPGVEDRTVHGSEYVLLNGKQRLELVQRLGRLAQLSEAAGDSGAARKDVTIRLRAMPAQRTAEGEVAIVGAREILRSGPQLAERKTQRDQVGVVEGAARIAQVTLEECCGARVLAPIRQPADLLGE
jgi:hypothetical protein